MFVSFNKQTNRNPKVQKLEYYGDYIAHLNIQQQYKDADLRKKQSLVNTVC